MTTTHTSRGITTSIVGGFLALFLLCTPFMYASAAPLVPECGKVVTSEPDDKGVTTTSIPAPCDFDYLVTLINNVINFLLFIVAAPLVAIILCYAGALMIFSGGSSEKVTKAKHMIKSVVIGYIIALAAWLIINTILKTLGFNGPTFLT